MPGLAADFGGYAPAALPPATALSLWLRRAAVSDFAADWCEPAVTALCYGSTAAQQAPPAVAALSYREDFDAPPPGWCLRADPVHLRADTRGLVLFDADSFQLDDAQSRALVATLDAHLAADGWRLSCRHPLRWYLVGGAPQQLLAQPLPLVRGSPVAAMPWQGADAGDWVGRLNELQMLLHSDPVNAARAAAGQAPINSVWLWGAGEAPPAGRPAYSRLFAANVYARGLARHTGVPSSDVPPNAGELLAADDGHDLVVLEDCRAAAAYEDLGAWQSAVERLEGDWLEPLVAALGQGRLRAIDLYPLNGQRYRLTRWRLRAWWQGAGDYRRQARFRRPGANRV